MTNRAPSTQVVFAAILIFSLHLMLLGRQAPKTNVVELVALPPGGSLEAPGTVVTAEPIQNQGTAVAGNVSVSSVTLQGGTPQPSPLPLRLGAIAPGESATTFASFSSNSIVAGGTYLLSVTGSYTE